MCRSLRIDFFEELRLKFYERKTASVRRANTFQYIYATYNQHKTEREKGKGPIYLGDASKKSLDIITGLLSHKDQLGKTFLNCASNQAIYLWRGHRRG